MTFCRQYANNSFALRSFRLHFDSSVPTPGDPGDPNDPGDLPTVKHLPNSSSDFLSTLLLNADAIRSSLPCSELLWRCCQIHCCLLPDPAGCPGIKKKKKIPFQEWYHLKLALADVVWCFIQDENVVKWLNSFINEYFWVWNNNINRLIVDWYCWFQMLGHSLRLFKMLRDPGDPDDPLPLVKHLPPPPPLPAVASARCF